MTATEERLRVAVVSPPLDASGGIGRVMSYALGQLTAGADHIVVLDTRGHTSSPLLSVLPLMRACVRLLALGGGRRIDVVHVNMAAYGSAWRKSMVVRVCRVVRVPVVLHLHAGNFPEFFDRRGRWGKRFIRHTFEIAATVIVLTEGWRRLVRDELRVDEGKIVVLANAAPGPTTLPPARADAETSVRLLFLSRLSTDKGVPELLTALASPPLLAESWHATFAGDGDIARFSGEAQRRGLGERTTFTGWVDAHEAERLLSSSDVLVLPSHVEALPVALIEALAHGLSVVTTPVGSIAEVVTDGVDALLVPPGDPDALADALLRVIRDVPLRVSLGAAARATWARSHAIDAYARRLRAEWVHVARSSAACPTRSLGAQVVS